MPSRRLLGAAARRRRVTRLANPASAETWTGTNGAAWPGAWTLTPSGGSITIQSNQGRIVSSASAYVTSYARRAGVADGELLLRFQMPTLAERYDLIHFRESGTSCYRTLLDGNELALQRVDSGSATWIGSTLPFTPTAGVWYRLRIRWVGSSLAAKLWLDTDTEPELWSVSATDTTYTAAGTIALTLSSGAAGAVTTLFDDLQMWNGPVTPGPNAPGTVSAARVLGWGTPDSTWSDEFNYVGSPDPTKWLIPPPGGMPGHDGNGLRHPDQVTVDGEKLIMAGLANGDTGWLMSAQQRQYGRFEARCRSYATGTGTGTFHPLFICIPSGPWPQGGEYDWLEMGNPGGMIASAYLHYPHDPDPVPIQQEYAERGPCDMTQWHNIAFEWNSTHLKGWIDGVPWYEFSGGANTVRQDIQTMPAASLTMQFDNFFGTSDNQPAQFEAQWIRVYAP